MKISSEDAFVQFQFHSLDLVVVLLAVVAAHEQLRAAPTGTVQCLCEAGPPAYRWGVRYHGHSSPTQGCSQHPSVAAPSGKDLVRGAFLTWPLIPRTVMPPTKARQISTMKSRFHVRFYFSSFSAPTKSCRINISPSHSQAQ